MIQKILAVGIVVLLGVVTTLALQLRSAHSDVTTLTGDRDKAVQEASNAKAAQQTGEAQNARLAASFASLDNRLSEMGQDQRRNAQQLAQQLAQLPTLQKSEGDTDASFQCLDTAVPRQLDQWLHDSPAGANGGHGVP